MTDFECIEELDVNPFLVGATAEQSMAVDGRIRIDPEWITSWDFTARMSPDDS